MWCTFSVILFQRRFDRNPPELSLLPLSHSFSAKHWFKIKKNSRKIDAAWIKMRKYRVIKRDCQFISDRSRIYNNKFKWRFWYFNQKIQVIFFSFLGCAKMVGWQTEFCMDWAQRYTWPWAPPGTQKTHRSGRTCSSRRFLNFGIAIKGVCQHGPPFQGLYRLQTLLFRIC